VTTSFLFLSAQGHVGEPIQAQLMLHSTAHQNTAPVTFSKVRCLFRQNHYEFEISHQNADEPATKGTLAEVLDFTQNRSVVGDENGRIVFKATTNLSFHPGRHVVFNIAFDIKEPGGLELESLVSEIETPEFRVNLSSQPANFASPSEWYTSVSESRRLRKRITREEPWSIEILPKPPKLEVQILNVERSMYIDEPISIDFQITNGEEEDVTPTLDVRILTRGTPPEIAWIHSEESEPPSDSDGEVPPSRTLNLPCLSPNKSLTRTAIFTAPSSAIDLILESKLHYYLPSDPELPLSKTFTTNLSIVSPFEANFEFTPYIHPDSWPSFFAFNSPIPGLLQRWSLTAKLGSFASEPIIVHKSALEIEHKPTNLEYTMVNGIIEDDTPLQPQNMRNLEFVFDTTRPSAKEQRNMSVTTQLVVIWSRINNGSAPVASTLHFSPISLPPLEPRVVATAKQLTLPPQPPSSPTDETPSNPEVGRSSNVLLSLITLFMENPTNHPLTFDVTVPSSEALAFSGPKQQSVTILPYSRTEVDFRVLPLVCGGVWAVFGVKVVDRYFVREVEVLPGQGVVAPEEGGGVRWWIE
jgi:trafficking protein particle complex subunit 11